MLEIQDILLISLAVILLLILLFCAINICYYLWIRSKSRNADANGEGGKNGRSHHYEHRSNAYEYNFTPDNQYEQHTTQYSSEGPVQLNGKT